MNKQNKYTDEKNVLLLISLLRQHGIRRIIASPGTTNMTFIGSVQNDDFFKVYSCVDERSAAYMACGMAEECGEPVVISCTGATASRNYMSALTEAYYRKLPVLAVTSFRGVSEIGHLKDQQIDRRQRPSDICVESVEIPLVTSNKDSAYCTIEINKAILALRKEGGGPIHINLATGYSQNFSVQTLPKSRKIMRFGLSDPLPHIPYGRVAVYVGVHKDMDKELIDALDTFCESHNAVVFASPISGYKGKYGVNPSLLCAQREYRSELMKPDLMIHIGEISGILYNPKPKNVWRVSEDGALRDTFGVLSNVFQMPEKIFFTKYANHETTRTSYYVASRDEIQRVKDLIPDLPFSNLWIAQNIHDKIPDGAELHFGILNSLRSWSFFDLHESIYARSNVGGYGIDGGMSSMIGSSLVNADKLYIGIFGDLSFFYDMNCLGNRHIGKNIRIMLINNGKGTEFRNYYHPCYSYGDDADSYMAAAGHYGNKSPMLVRHYTEDLGFKYLTASNKYEFNEVYAEFLDSKILQPILLEVFTNSEDESEALRIMMNLVNSPSQSPIKKVVKTIVGDGGIKFIKKIIGKE